MTLPCRPACGACCVALSISSPLPGLPQGKPAGMACPHLDPELRCALWGLPERPRVCADLRPEPEMCGSDREHALAFLARLEAATRPGP